MPGMMPISGPLIGLARYGTLPPLDLPGNYTDGNYYFYKVHDPGWLPVRTLGGPFVQIPTMVNQTADAGPNAADLRRAILQVCARHRHWHGCGARQAAHLSPC